jgi:hypothetical protein
MKVIARTTLAVLNAIVFHHMISVNRVALNGFVATNYATRFLVMCAWHESPSTISSRGKHAFSE